MRSGSVVIVFFALQSACSYQLFSPPARMVHLESARTVARGESVAGAHGAAYTAIFDPGVLVATAGVRHGVATGVEVDVDGTFARVDASDQDDHLDIDGNIYAGRIGVKVDGASRHAAVTAGIGGGISPAAGSFTAADIGMILSYDNCYVVPFFSGSATVSVPIHARPVDMGYQGTATAHTTYGIGTGAGIEIPLDSQRCREGKTPARVQLGVTVHRLTSTEGPMTRSCGSGCTKTSGGDYTAAGLGAGFEFPF